MKAIKLYALGFIIFAVLSLFGLAAYNQSVASKTTAQASAKAAIIQAQGQARLDSAQANAVSLGAMFPYAILGASMLLSGSIMAIGVMMVFAAPQTAGRIETRTIVLIAPGQSKREVFRQLNSGE